MTGGNSTAAVVSPASSAAFYVEPSWSSSSEEEEEDTDGGSDENGDTEDDTDDDEVEALAPPLPSPPLRGSDMAVALVEQLGRLARPFRTNPKLSLDKTAESTEDGVVVLKLPWVVEPSLPVLGLLAGLLSSNVSSFLKSLTSSPSSSSFVPPSTSLEESMICAVLDLLTTQVKNSLMKDD